MTRLADQFAEIRARRDELAAERDKAIAGAPAADPQHQALQKLIDDTELLEALFGGDRSKIFAHTDALGPPDYPSSAYVIPWGGGIELTLDRDGWTVAVPLHGYSLGPLHKLRHALEAVRMLRELM